jgi:hypothetical protein
VKYRVTSVETSIDGRDEKYVYILKMEAEWTSETLTTTTRDGTWRQRPQTARRCEVRSRRQYLGLYCFDW